MAPACSPGKRPKTGRGTIGQVSGSSYAGMNRIKFAGLIDHLSAITAHPGQDGVYATRKISANSGGVTPLRGLLMAYP